MNEIRSKTGRKIRKDSFEAHHDMDLVSKAIRSLYCDFYLSTNQIPFEMKKRYGIEISSLKCYYLLKNMGLTRGKSESVSLAMSTLDSHLSLLDSNILSIIEGILIGDGTINCNDNTKKARLTISGSYKEFIEYCYRLLSPYCPNEPKYIDLKGKKGSKGVWYIHTKFHPDFYKIYQKWYVPKKDIPKDINFTPQMMLLWYLGDGSISARDDGNSVSLYFSTNSFSRDHIENYLVPKFSEIGVEVSRITKNNCLFIKTNSIVRLLQYMGGSSPVKCYSYKFDIDEWRFKKPMKEVAKELCIDYYKLANWVKNGLIWHSRSPGGKKVLFSPKEFEELKRKINSGDLPREKGRRAFVNKKHLKKTQENEVISRQYGEKDEQYLDRMVDIFQDRGFPYKYYSQEEKQKRWVRLRVSQYIVPSEKIISWRKHGLSLADSFHPHIYELNRKNKISPFDLFTNKELLKKCLYNDGVLSSSMTRAKLFSYICSNVKSLRLNNFSPSLARDIYNYYCDDGYKIIDPCAGFSGRMIGASVSKKSLSYFGIEPSLRTYSGLVRTKEFLNIVNPNFECNIENSCAEDALGKYRDNYFNFAFTSPPYFNTEEYGGENTQSYIRFSIYDEWKEKFLGKLIKETYRILERKSKFVINIGKSGKHYIVNDIMNIAEEVGFSLFEKKFISFPVYEFVVSKKERLEPMVVFQKD